MISFGVHLVDSSVKKPFGKIDDVLIIVNDNYVPIDFLVMGIKCDPSCPIILGQPCDTLKIKPCTVIIHAGYTTEIKDSR